MLAVHPFLFFLLFNTFAPTLALPIASLSLHRREPGRDDPPNQSEKPRPPIQLLLPMGGGTPVNPPPRTQLLLPMGGGTPVNPPPRPQLLLPFGGGTPINPPPSHPNAHPPAHQHNPQSSRKQGAPPSLLLPFGPGAPASPPSSTSGSRMVEAPSSTSKTPHASTHHGRGRRPDASLGELGHPALGRTNHNTPHPDPRAGKPNAPKPRRADATRVDKVVPRRKDAERRVRVQVPVSSGPLSDPPLELPPVPEIKDGIKNIQLWERQVNVYNELVGDMSRRGEAENGEHWVTSSMLKLAERAVEVAEAYESQCLGTTAAGVDGIMDDAWPELSGKIKGLVQTSKYRVQSIRRALKGGLTPQAVFHPVVTQSKSRPKVAWADWLELLGRLNAHNKQYFDRPALKVGRKKKGGRDHVVFQVD